MVKLSASISIPRCIDHAKHMNTYIIAFFSKTPPKQYYREMRVSLRLLPSCILEYASLLTDTSIREPLPVIPPMVPPKYAGNPLYV